MIWIFIKSVNWVRANATKVPLNLACKRSRKASKIMPKAILMNNKPSPMSVMCVTTSCAAESQDPTWHSLHPSTPPPRIEGYPGGWQPTLPLKPCGDLQGRLVGVSSHLGDGLEWPTSWWGSCGERTLAMATTLYFLFFQEIQYLLSSVSQGMVVLVQEICTKGCSCKWQQLFTQKFRRSRLE